MKKLLFIAPLLTLLLLLTGCAPKAPAPEEVSTSMPAQDAMPSVEETVVHEEAMPEEDSMMQLDTGIESETEVMVIEAPAPKTVSVSIRNLSFVPATITINPGDTVTWTNDDSVPHTATGSGFDTGMLSKGQSGSHTFSSAGTFDYICTTHPAMKGQVVVTK